MRLDIKQHRTHPWKVHGLMGDFTLDEVRAYPITADPAAGEDFAMFCSMMERGDASPGGAAGLLIALRERLGHWFGWDSSSKALPIPGCSETSLRSRLPEVQPNSPPNKADSFGFKLVYETEAERLMEISNTTVHAALHVGWVEHDDGTAGAEMAVYWKPRGWFGRLYMAVITPFRFFVVYPALMRQVGAEWEKTREMRPTPPADGLR